MHFHFNHVHRKIISMPKRPRPYPSPSKTPKRRLVSSAINAAVGAATKYAVTKMAEAASGASTSKSASTQAIESKDSPSGRTYVYKKRSAKATKKAKQRLVKKKKFENKVLAAINAGQFGTKIFTFTDKFDSSAVAVDTQGLQTFCAYGNIPIAAGVGRGHRDLRRMLAADSMNDSGTKFVLTSYWGQFTIINQNVSQFFVDIYKVTNRKNESDQKALDTIWTDDLTLSGTQAGASAQSPITWGQTLFQSPLTCQRFKVLDKVTVALGQNETYKFEVRNNRPFNYDSAKLDDYGYIQPTFMYMMVFYGRPTTLNSAGAIAAGGVTITYNRSYTYRRGVTGANQPTDTANGGLAS
nr:MAG: capsid protein [Chemarfal virus 193]